MTSQPPSTPLSGHSLAVFSLNNFEGPLEFLLWLIQHEELDIREVQLCTLMQQFLQKAPWRHQGTALDEGAEFIAAASLLCYLKSQRLIPSSQKDEGTEDALLFLQLLPQVVDYCRFKTIAEQLAKQEEKQSPHYFRGHLPPEPRNTRDSHAPALRDVSLDSLAQVFKTILDQAAATPKKIIQEEVWRVGDKIRLIRAHLRQMPRLALAALFPPEKGREELIVTFLALLELMKNYEALVQQDDMGHYWISPPTRPTQTT